MNIIKQLVLTKYEKYLNDSKEGKGNFWDFFQALQLVQVQRKIDNGIEVKQDVKNALNEAWKLYNADKNGKIKDVLSVAVLQSNLIISFLKEFKDVQVKEERVFDVWRPGSVFVDSKQYS